MTQRPAVRPPGEPRPGRSPSLGTRARSRRVAWVRCGYGLQAQSGRPRRCRFHPRVRCSLHVRRQNTTKATKMSVQTPVAVITRSVDASVWFLVEKQRQSVFDRELREHVLAESSLVGRDVSQCEDGRGRMLFRRHFIVHNGAGHPQLPHLRQIHQESRLCDPLQSGTALAYVYRHRCRVCKVSRFSSMCCLRTTSLFSELMTRINLIPTMAK